MLTLTLAFLRRSGIIVLIASLMLPPLGLLLLWFRPATRLVTKLLGSVTIAVLAVIYLAMFFDLRLERAGSGFPTILIFHNPESHAQALERNRIQHRHEEATVQPRMEVKQSGDFVVASEKATAETPPRRGSTYWTAFRGPRRDGHYDEMKTLTAWRPDGLQVLWRQPIGGGYASFAIAEGRAFTIEQRRDREVVAAYDVETGRELWTHSWQAEFRESMGGDGPRATPTWDEGRLYALGATGELHCLNAENGKLIWSLNILSDNRARNLTWGMAASPLVVDDKVIVLPGGRSGESVVAYDKRTGKPVWKVLDDQQAYTSPMVVTLAGQQQLLVVSAERAMGLAVEDGSLLWDYPWVTQFGINSAQPIAVDGNHFFISAGYGHGAALVEVIQTENGFTARTVWENINMKNKFNSSVLYQQHIYGLDEGILACIDARTGERKWKSGRYGYGQVLLASGYLIVLTETGDLVLVKATPERHEEVARFSALEGKSWNHPAIADGHLLVRNAREMAAYKIAAH